MIKTVETIIEEKFAAVTVEKKSLDLAVDALKKAKADSFKYSLVHDQLEGVKRENAVPVGNIVCDKLSLEDPEHTKKVKNTFQLFQFSTDQKAKLEELSLDVNEFKSIYGFIIGIEDEEGDLDIGYTIYQLEFELKDAPEFTVDEMEAIKRHYMKNEALLTLKQENVIKSINYI